MREILPEIHPLTVTKYTKNNLLTWILRKHFTQNSKCGYTRGASFAKNKNHPFNWEEDAK